MSVNTLSINIEKKESRGVSHPETFFASVVLNGCFCGGEGFTVNEAMERLFNILNQHSVDWKF